MKNIVSVFKNSGDSFKSLTVDMAEDVQKSFSEVISKANNHSAMCMEAVELRNKNIEAMKRKIEEDSILCEELVKASKKSERFANNLQKLMQ